MAVVRFKKRAPRRIFLRHYICSEAGPLRITSRLARELAHRKVAAPTATHRYDQGAFSFDGVHTLLHMQFRCVG